LHRISSDFKDGAYQSMKGFLERDIKMKVPDHDIKHIVSPCSGRLVCYDRFSECASIWARGSKFSVLRLVGDAAYDLLLESELLTVSERKTYSRDSLEELRSQNKIEYKKALTAFADKLAVCIVRMPVGDYHGVHCPLDDATIVGMYEIEGALYSVLPIVVNRDVNVLTENQRVCVLMESPRVGLCCMVIVASFLTWDILMLCELGQQMECGQLMAKNSRHVWMCVDAVPERRRRL